MFFTIGDIGIGRQITIVIQKEVEFYSPFSPSELRPGKEGKARRDSGAVKREQLVFESELMFSRWCCFAGIKGLIEEIPEHFPGSVGIGVGEGRFFGCLAHVKMAKFTRAAG